MHSWLVAAAAAAGYFATYWQNLSRDRNGFPDFTAGDSSVGKPDTQKGPFHKLAWRRKPQEDVSANGREVSTRKVSDIFRSNVSSAAEMDSASGFDGEKFRSMGNENLRGDECGKGPGADDGDNSAKPSITRMHSINDPMRKRSSLKSKYSYRHLHKPQRSLDSCPMAQPYMQHVKMEEYVLSSLPSPSTLPLRPLLVADGSRIISRASGDFSNGIGKNKLHNEATIEKSGYVLGIPPLPKKKSFHLPNKLPLNRGNRHNERLSIPCSMDTDKQFHSQCGSRDGAVLIFLGISIGIISSYVENRREVDKLRGLLKQTENLVQDLQEELEMKCSLTLKELANENYESREPDDISFHERATNSCSLEQNMINSTSYHGKESYGERVEESSESMSKIEAELEAELERLGLNMNVANLEKRLSDLVELDPDFIADFAEGELRSDMVNGQALVQSVSSEDRSGTSTTPSGNDAVSPRELSLRLHEVIQSRLEERVQELEVAIQNSQKKVKLIESQHKNSWKISNSKWKYSSTPKSHLINSESPCISKPLVLKLSGEALDAYNEACEELLKVDESEEEDAASDIYENNHWKELHLFDENMSWGGENGVNGSLPHRADYAMNISEEPFSGHPSALEEQPARVEELLDVGVSEDECSDCDDAMEKQLIQQIVEKARKGSAVLLNAQRILFSMDEI